MKSKFPKRIYVTHDENSSAADRINNSDLLAWGNPEIAGEDGETVGIYELVETKTQRVTRQLV